MSRLVLILAATLAFSAAPAAFAKDLCIQFDTGGESGSRLVLKKIKLRPGNVAPLQGYMSRLDPALQTYFEFIPIDGQSIVNSNGELVLGLVIHNVAIRASGFNALDGSNAINFGCTPGPDGKFGPLDPCTGWVYTSSTAAHVIECADVDPIP